jgi:CheY-like chemotaxis protein
MPRVLIVDDEPLLRLEAAEDFAAAGFEAHQAATGLDALALLNTDRHWDLLFTDINMPGTIDGWQLAGTAMSMLPKLRVIYISGYEQTISNLSGRESFLSKPYDFSQVEKALRGFGIRA